MLFRSHSSIAAVTSAADAPSRLCHYAVAMEIRGDLACRCCDYDDARTGRRRGMRRRRRSERDVRKQSNAGKKWTEEENNHE